MLRLLLGKQQQQQTSNTARLAQKRFCGRNTATVKSSNVPSLSPCILPRSRSFHSSCVSKSLDWNIQQKQQQTPGMMSLACSKRWKTNDENSLATTKSAAAAAFSTFTSTRTENVHTSQQQQSSLMSISAAFALALAATAGGATSWFSNSSSLTSTTRSRTTFCEAAEKATKATSDNNHKAAAQEVEEEDNDLFDDLPDDDEETTCTMCQTFRKGPCRPYWRKVEACFKKYEHEENGASKCTRYFIPHQNCLMEYTNLYQLISLHMKQDLVRDAELSVAPHERRSTNNTNFPATIDWSAWTSYAQEQGIDIVTGSDALTATSSSSSSSSSNSNSPIRRRTSERMTVLSSFFPNKKKQDDHTKSKIPLWKRVPENTEPVLLTVTAMIDDLYYDQGEKSDDDDDDMMLLKVAYVLDQDDMVVGFSYNQAYGDLLEQADSGGALSEDSTGKEGQGINNIRSRTEANSTDRSAESKQVKSEKGDGNDESPSSPSPSSFQLEFFVLPGETRQVRVKAMYAENPVHADPNKDILDVCLVEGPWISLAQVAAAASNAKKANTAKK